MGLIYLLLAMVNITLAGLLIGFMICEGVNVIDSVFMVLNMALAYYWVTR